MFPLVAAASEGVNYVVVSGQIINYEYGNPVKNHSVFIQQCDNSGNPEKDIIELLTDNEGFFYDSIATTNTKGAFTIFTYDYYGKRIDTTLYYRFLIFNSNVLVANFKIYMPYQMEKVQARFNYYQKIGDNRFKFLFKDLTKTSNIISRKWNFGDGTTSNEKNVEHLYSATGFYKITLSVKALVNNEVQTSSFSRMIYISDRSYYNFGGHAFCQYFPIDVGVAYLYMLDSSRSFIPIDTAYLDTLGYYYFYQVPAAEYLVKAQPTKNSSSYGKMLPTYYGDKISWENASIIHLTETGWEYDIHLKSVEGSLQSGNGFIHGNISFFNGLKEGGELPVEGVTVYLLNGNFVSLIYHYSDGNGDFNFSNIAFGDYSLKPEITGVHCDEVSIEVSGTQPVVDSIKILIQDGEASLSVPEQKHFSQDFFNSIYPSPALSQIKLAIQSSSGNDMEWKIFDMSGRFIKNGFYSLQPGNNIININIPDLDSGLYLMEIIWDSGKKAQKKFSVR
jgi:PKD repeat protein